MNKQTPKELDIYVGKRLRALRIEQGMSLDILGEIIDVSYQQISRYELGQNRLGASQLYRLSRGLNVPISWFFKGFKEDSDELERLETALREDRKEWQLETKDETKQALFDAWENLPTDLQKERIVSLMEAISFKV